MWKRPYKTRKVTAGLTRKLPKAQKGHVGSEGESLKGKSGLTPEASL